MPNSYLYFYLFVFKYFNYVYIKNTKLLLKKKKKKNPTTSRKNFSFSSRNFYGFFLKNSLKHSKIFVIQILYSYHNQHSSILTYIVFHVFKSQFFFYLLQFLSQSINSNVSLGFNFLQFSISFLNIIPYYLISFLTKKKIIKYTRLFISHF